MTGLENEVGKPRKLRFVPNNFRGSHMYIYNYIGWALLHYTGSTVIIDTQVKQDTPVVAGCFQAVPFNWCNMLLHVYTYPPTHPVPVVLVYTMYY